MKKNDKITDVIKNKEIGFALLDDLFAPNAGGA